MIMAVFMLEKEKEGWEWRGRKVEGGRGDIKRRDDNKTNEEKGIGEGTGWKACHVATRWDSWRRRLGRYSDCTRT